MTTWTTTPSAAGTVTAGNVARMSGVYDVTQYGATGGGTVDDAAAITTAITAAGSSGIVWFPPGTYKVDSAITLTSGVTLWGVPGQSWLKVGAASAYDLLSSTSGALEDVTIDGLGFDGSLNYPASSQVYQFAGTFSLNRGIGISRTADTGQSSSDIINLVIRNCHFYRLSADGIEVNGHNNKHITIRDNYFSQGSYRGSAIRVRPPTAANASQGPTHVLITGNIIDTCGPQIYYDASKEDYIASADGISVDRIYDSEISLNRVHKAGSVGIRVEDSERVSVVGNTVTESGSDGITFYKNCYDCSAVGNTVKSWGRTPPAYCIRNYNSGTYVVAREFPRAAGPTLPADPTGSSWFETWPYITSNTDTSTIVAYDSSDYYVSTAHDGILPFRGNAAISVTQESERITVVGNATAPDTTQTGGKYNYASDFGFTPCHMTNDATSTTGNDCYIAANDFRGRVYPIYFPRFHDLINTRGTLGTASFAARGKDNSIINSNRPSFAARPASAQSNLATGSPITVAWGTEFYDQAGNFASNTFTAPMTGKYQFSIMLDLRSLDTAATLYEVNLVTSNRSYPYYLHPAALATDPTHYSLLFSVTADMDKDDTAYVTIQQTGGTAQTDIETNSRFSGILID